MKTFTVTDIDGDDWSGTYEQFRAEVYRLSLPVCPHCGGRVEHGGHWCAGLAKLMHACQTFTAPAGPVWHGDA